MTALSDRLTREQIEALDLELSRHIGQQPFALTGRDLAATALALMEENERLRGLVFTAYCEGYIAAGGAWQDDNGWAQSEVRAALTGEKPR